MPGEQLVGHDLSAQLLQLYGIHWLVRSWREGHACNIVRCHVHGIRSDATVFTLLARQQYLSNTRRKEVYINNANDFAITINNTIIVYSTKDIYKLNISISDDVSARYYNDFDMLLLNGNTSLIVRSSIRPAFIITVWGTGKISVWELTVSPPVWMPSSGGGWCAPEVSDCELAGGTELGVGWLVGSITGALGG